MIFNTKSDRPNRTNLLARLRTNTDGVAAIEFALIAPIMLIMYLGVAEVSLAISADRTVSHTASVVADLATQDNKLSKADVENIFDAAVAVMGIDNADKSNLSMDISSYIVDSSNKVVREGYAVFGSGFGAPAPAGGVSSTLLNQTSGLVIARIRYKYKSPANMFVKDLTLKETFMLKPRKSKSIPINSGNSFVCQINNGTNRPKVHC